MALSFRGLPNELGPRFYDGFVNGPGWGVARAVMLVIACGARLRPICVNAATDAADVRAERDRIAGRNDEPIPQWSASSRN
jgi:hypothetical protein